MADKIIFSNKINVSAQIGDELWYSDVTIPSDPTGPMSLGIITEISDTWIKVNTPVSSLGQTYPDLIVNGGFTINWSSNIINNGDFLSDSTGWSSLPTGMTWNNSAIDIDGTATQYAKLNQDIATVMTGSTTGDRYRVEFEISNYSSGKLTGRLSNATDSVVFPNNATSSSHATIEQDGNYSYIVALGDSSFNHGDRFYLQVETAPFVGTIDNITIEKLLPAANWYTDGTWDIIGQSSAIKTGITAGYVRQDYTTPLIEGEEYTLTMDIVGGSPSTGDILIVNTSSSSPVDVSVTITGNTGTATWTQSSVNTDTLNIYQSGDGDAEIDNVTLNQSSFDLQSALSGVAPEKLFFMFKKPSDQNIASLNGYYAETTLTNSSNEKRELFSVGAETTVSSK